MTEVAIRLALDSRVRGNDGSGNTLGPGFPRPRALVSLRDPDRQAVRALSDEEIRLLYEKGLHGKRFAEQL